MTYADIANVALGDLIDETTFNQILANLRSLYNPPSAHVELDLLSDRTTSSNAFADVDSVNLKLTLALDASADVLVHFHGLVSASTTGMKILFDITVDGIRVAGDDGIGGQTVTANSLFGGTMIAFTRLIPALSPGNHEFRLQWKTSSGTATLYAGAGTSGLDVHPQFWVARL